MEKLAEELLENVEEVEKAVYEEVAEIEENGEADDSVLELAKDLADVQEMEDSLMQVLVNTETEEDNIMVFIMS